MKLEVSVILLPLKSVDTYITLTPPPPLKELLFHGSSTIIHFPRQHSSDKKQFHPGRKYSRVSPAKFSSERVRGYQSRIEREIGEAQHRYAPPLTHFLLRLEPRRSRGWLRALRVAHIYTRDAMPRICAFKSENYFFAGTRHILSRSVVCFICVSMHQSPRVGRERWLDYVEDFVDG